MKLKNILLLGLGCVAWVPASAKAEEEGFVFTEEEVAAYEEEARKMQALVSDERAYRRACLQATSDIMLIVGNCYRAMGKEVDLLECADAKSLASIHREAAEKLMSKFAVDAATGRIQQGVFCRETLKQAQPHMSPDTYADIESQIKRMELLFRWFLGPFAQTCAIYNDEFYEEVQKVARFKELTQTSEYKRMEQEYIQIWKFFADGSALLRLVEVERAFAQKPQQQALAFFARFHNRLSVSEREAWYNEVVLDAPNGVNSQYIRLTETGTSWAPTAPGAELSNYERCFDYWSEDHVSAAVELGKKAYAAAMPGNGSEAYSAYVEAVKNGPQDLHANTYHAYVSKTEPQLFKLSEVLWSFEDYLKNNTKFLENRKMREKRCIRDYGDVVVKSFKVGLNNLRDKAAQHVPASHPSRQTD